KLTGEDVSPETVRTAPMYRILASLEAALEEMGREIGLEFDEREALIIPTGGYEDSSLGLPGRVRRRAQEPLDRIGGAFQAEEAELPGGVRSPLRDVQATLGDREASLDVESQTADWQSFSMSEDAPVIPKPQDEVVERTSHGVVYGICMRVNRSRPDATVVLHDGTKCKVKPIDDEQVQALMAGTGADLEQVFRIEGEATWNVDDYRITEIDPVTIEPVERNAGEFFDELRDATDGAFDDTDPVEFVRKLRGE
ncbi:MAG: hypothetical protein ABEN55_03570, partial [Bradymonadaceae bacterium]